MKNEVFVKEACQVFRGHVMVGIDAKDGLAAIEGWTEKTSEPAVDVARRYEGYGLEAVIYTDIKRDGMETGINIEATRIFAEAIEIPVIASGGVAGIEDIKKVVEIETAGVMGIIVGKALYTGGLYLPEAIMMAKSKKDL